MSDNLGNHKVRLEKLVRQIIKEKDPLRYDELCSKLWLVLDERKMVASVESRVGGASKDGRAIPTRHER